MSRLLNTVRLHRALDSAKSLNSSSRTIFNTRIHFNEGKNKKDSNNQTADKGTTQPVDGEKKKEAHQKLQNLLTLMIKKEPEENVLKIQVPRPRVKAQEKRRKMEAEYLERQKQIEEEKIDFKLEKAASEIAQKLGGNTEQTESELLEIYLGRTITPAVSTVEDSDHKSHDKEDKINMKNLLLSLEIEKPTADEHESLAHRVANYRKDAKKVIIPRIPLSRSRSQVKKVDLFGAEPLNIFTTNEEGKKGPPTESTMWEYLQARDLKLSVTHPPANIFEQLISWTEQGKIWKFPIDNEQGWEETEVDFTEHVFLEHMLEPWCPQSGIIRHFMELVCVGLSKNPYLSVQEKHAHIIFYEHYFRQKNSLLVELGLEPIKDRPEAEAQQQAVAV